MTSRRERRAQRRLEAQQRQTRKPQPPRRFCNAGHLMSKANTYIGKQTKPNGKTYVHRQCRACKRIDSARRYRAKHEAFALRYAENQKELALLAIEREHELAVERARQIEAESERIRQAEQAEAERLGWRPELGNYRAWLLFARRESSRLPWRET